MIRLIMESLEKLIKKSISTLLTVIKNVINQHIIKIFYNFTVLIVSLLNAQNVYLIQIII